MPDRYRKLFAELLAFGFAGVVNTAFGFLLFNLLFSMGTLTANAISTAGGTATSFVLNRYITYRHRPRTSLRRELPLFAAVNLVGLGIQQGVMALGKVAFNLQADDRLEFNLIRVGSVIVGTIFLLLCYRGLIFKEGKEAVAADIALEIGAPIVDPPHVASRPASAVGVAPVATSPMPVAPRFHPTPAGAGLGSANGHPPTNGFAVTNGHAPHNGFAAANGHADHSRVAANGITAANGYEWQNGGARANGPAPVNGIAPVFGAEPNTADAPRMGGRHAAPSTDDADTRGATYVASASHQSGRHAAPSHDGLSDDRHAKVDDFDELTVPLEVELAGDLEFGEFVPADAAEDAAVRSQP